MPSWQARLLSLFLRHTVKRQLAKAHDVSGIRAVFDRSLYSAPSSVGITQASLNGVSGEWVEDAHGPQSNQILLFLHGGGYVACTPKTHRPYSCFLAQRGFRVFMPDYRLAPEHPFPAGLDDAVAVYRGLRVEYPDSTIAIAGDSAGGGLALAVMLRLRDEGNLLPGAAALFSPLTNLTDAGGSRVSNDGRCAMFHGKGLATIPGYYAPGAEMRNPFLSPVYADFKGFPPLLIHVGEDETLRDDSVRLAARAREAGVRVDLKLWPAVSHDWQLMYRFVPEGRASLEEAAAFLKGRS